MKDSKRPVPAFIIFRSYAGWDLWDQRGRPRLHKVYKTRDAARKAMRRLRTRHPRTVLGD